MIECNTIKWRYIHPPKLCKFDLVYWKCKFRFSVGNRFNRTIYTW